MQTFLKFNPSRAFLILFWYTVDIHRPISLYKFTYVFKFTFISALVFKPVP